MPTESSRKVSTRRIFSPDDDSTYIDLKVVDSITFVDDKHDWQETTFNFSNGPSADRSVEIAEVGENKLKVERIKTIQVTDEKDGFQETLFRFSNTPPTHLKTRKVKVYALNSDKTKNTSVYVEVERIDQFSFIDEKDGFQETIFTLAWPDVTDPEYDYTDLKPPIYSKTSINPPYRLDPYQNITDASFDNKVLLVFYGTNQIAALKINGVNKFKLVSKKTLAQSNWANPNPGIQDDWEYRRTPSYILYTAQMKLSPTFHPFTVSLKIDNGVVTVPNTWEQRPFYNVADTILKYAECSTPSYDSGGYGTDPYYFSHSNCPIINGTSECVFNEYLDKFVPTTDGIKKVGTGPAIPNHTTYAPHSLNNDFIYIYPPLSISADGLRCGPIFYAGGNFETGWTYTGQFAYVPAYTAAHDSAIMDLNQAMEDWAYSAPRRSTLQSYYYVGPGDSCATDWYPIEEPGDYSNSYSMTTKSMIYGTTGKLDKLELYNDTLDAWATNAFETTTGTLTYKGSTHTTYNGDATYTWESWIIGLPFPYNTGKTWDKSYMLYYLDTVVDGQPQDDYTIEVTTPYETWSATYQEYWVDYASIYDGWLQLSNGVYLIQGYVKKGVDKRIWMNGVEVGSTIASTIGCALADIVTMILDVKASDVSKLK